jgi:hypothetical protein
MVESALAQGEPIDLDFKVIKEDLFSIPNIQCM